MATLKKSSNDRLFKNQHTAFGVMFIAVAVLGGCSSVPDAINPVEWYKSTEEFFTGGDKEGQAARKTDTKASQLKADRGKPAPGADKPFPNLSKVPSGLRADTERRKYAKSISRQGDAKNVLTQEPSARKPQPARVASTPPPPKAAPAPRVTSVSPAAAQKSLPPVRLRPPSQMAAPTPSRIAPSAPRLTPPPMRTQQLAVRPSPTMAPAAPSLTYDPFQTVVVSSKGIEMGAQSQSMRQPVMRQQVLPSRSLAQLTQQATPSYPSGAVRVRQPAMGQGMVKVASILFTNGSSKLSQRDRQILGDVAQIQRESGGRPLVVVGHASSRTRDMKPLKHRHVNLRLSQNRANIVAGALRRLGISGQSLQTQAVGDTQPVYYEVMPSGEAGNRRADIYINY